MKALLALMLLLLCGCAGMKVVKPEEKNPNEGTKMLDLSSGEVKIVGTYTCNLAAMGHQFSALGKTEDEARKEVVAKCRDKAMITFCDGEKAKCTKN